jgi:hypothetical protein
MSPAAAAPAPISFPAPRMAAPTVMVSVTTPRDCPRAMLEAVLRRRARLIKRPEVRELGWNREMEVVGPVWEGLLAIVWWRKGGEAIGVPFVKARRAIGFACRNAEGPLRRAERAASWAMEFMMSADGIDDEEWSFGSLKLLMRGEEGDGKYGRRTRDALSKVEMKMAEVQGCIASFPVGTSYWPSVLQPHPSFSFFFFLAS